MDDLRRRPRLLADPLPRAVGADQDGRDDPVPKAGSDAGSTRPASPSCEDDPLAVQLARDLDGGFERLVRAEADRLFTIAYRLLGDREDAEEVAQDAFVRAYRALASYDRPRVEALALRPWLAAITMNLARNHRRRAATLRRGGAIDGDDLDHRSPGLSRAGGGPKQPSEPVADDPETAPDGVLLRREAEAAWAARLDALPARYRLPLILRHVAGLSTPEVALALGRPEGTVKAQLHRGLERLRAAYLAELDRVADGSRPDRTDTQGPHEEVAR